LAWCSGEKCNYIYRPSACSVLTNSATGSTHICLIYTLDSASLLVKLKPCKNIPAVSPIWIDWYPNRVLGYQFPVCNTKLLKIENFAGLYYPHFTTFRNETSEYY
jgi:hypothetical protein